MKNFARIFLGAFCALLAAVAISDTVNYAANVPVQVVPLFISGQRTATTTSVVKYTMPFKAKLLSAGAIARTATGTSPTLTVDLLQDGTSMLTAPIAVTATGFTAGTVSTLNMRDEGSISVNLAIGGTNPAWDDIMLLLTLVRQ